MKVIILSVIIALLVVTAAVIIFFRPSLGKKQIEDFEIEGAENADED